MASNRLNRHEYFKTKGDSIPAPVTFVQNWTVLESRQSPTPKAERKTKKPRKPGEDNPRRSTRINKRQSRATTSPLMQSVATVSAFSPKCFYGLEDHCGLVSVFCLSESTPTWFKTGNGSNESVPKCVKTIGTFDLTLRKAIPNLQKLSGPVTTELDTYPSFTFQNPDGAEQEGFVSSERFHKIGSCEKTRPVLVKGLMSGCHSIQISRISWYQLVLNNSPGKFPEATHIVIGQGAIRTIECTFFKGPVLPDFPSTPAEHTSPSVIAIPAQKTQHTKEKLQPRSQHAELGERDESLETDEETIGVTEQGPISSPNNASQEETHGFDPDNDPDFVLLQNYLASDPANASAADFAMESQHENHLIDPDLDPDFLQMAGIVMSADHPGTTNEVADELEEVTTEEDAQFYMHIKEEKRKDFKSTRSWSPLSEIPSEVLRAMELSDTRHATHTNTDQNSAYTDEPAQSKPPQNSTDNQPPISEQTRKPSDKDSTNPIPENARAPTPENKTPVRDLLDIPTNSTIVEDLLKSQRMKRLKEQERKIRTIRRIEEESQRVLEANRRRMEQFIGSKNAEKTQTSPNPGISRAKEGSRAQILLKDKQNDPTLDAALLTAGLAEEARLAEETRLAEEAWIAEQSRLFKESNLAQEAILAEESRIAEKARQLQLATKGERTLAEAAQITEDLRHVEDDRLAHANQAEEESMTVQEKLSEARPVENAWLVAKEATVPHASLGNDESPVDMEKLTRARVAEEKRSVEKERMADADTCTTEKKRIAEKEKLAQSRLAENARRAEKKSLADHERLPQSRLAEKPRLAEKKRLADHENESLVQSRLADEAQPAEEKKIAQAKLAEKKGLADNVSGVPDEVEPSPLTETTDVFTTLLRAPMVAHSLELMIEPPDIHEQCTLSYAEVQANNEHVRENNEVDRDQIDSIPIKQPIIENSRIESLREAAKRTQEALLEARKLSNARRLEEEKSRLQTRDALQRERNAKLEAERIEKSNRITTMRAFDLARISSKGQTHGFEDVSSTDINIHMMNPLELTGSANVVTKFNTPYKAPDAPKEIITISSDGPETSVESNRLARTSWAIPIPPCMGRSPFLAIVGQETENNIVPVPDDCDRVLEGPPPSTTELLPSTTSEKQPNYPMATTPRIQKPKQSPHHLNRQNNSLSLNRTIPESTILPSHEQEIDASVQQTALQSKVSGYPLIDHIADNSEEAELADPMLNNEAGQVFPMEPIVCFGHLFDLFEEDDRYFVVG